MTAVFVDIIKNNGFKTLIEFQLQSVTNSFNLLTKVRK